MNTHFLFRVRLISDRAMPVPCDPRPGGGSPESFTRHATILHDAAVGLRCLVARCDEAAVRLAPS
jgi:hypothetical protein